MFSYAVCLSSVVDAIGSIFFTSGCKKNYTATFPLFPQQFWLHFSENNFFLLQYMTVFAEFSAIWQQQCFDQSADNQLISQPSNQDLCASNRLG
jgi:hypothetical protein